jgi:1,4-dihydroxy-2-naphthoyl-CoA hydrolase
MPIWFDATPMEHVGPHNRETLVETLGIEVTEAGDDYLKGRMPVDRRTRQPAGVLHGGASVALAETLASWGAAFCVDRSRQSVVGMEINANHVRAVTEGYVHGIARPAHLGRASQIWEVRITDERDRLVCISRVTMAVLDRPTRLVGG